MNLHYTCMYVPYMATEEFLTMCTFIGQLIFNTYRLIIFQIRMRIQFALLIILVALAIMRTEARPPKKIPPPPLNISPEDLRRRPQPVQTGGERQPPAKARPDIDLEYARYLDQVVEALESDPNFKKRLASLKEEDLDNGYIRAEELDLIHHKVRSRLDDIKRREVERIKYLAMRQHEEDPTFLFMPSHVELTGPTFEKEDLTLLIKAAAKDLEEVDKARKEEFKRYEMEKKFQRKEHLKKIENEKEREAEENRILDMDKKHKDHEKPHHPMTKEQLEEVWEKQDHLDAQDFDPKTFFVMHDLNGDGHWDEDEVKVRLIAFKLKSVLELDL